MVEMNRAQSIKLKPWQEAASGSIAGIASRLVISPFDVVKIRLQLQSSKLDISNIIHQGGWTDAKYKGILQSFKLIVREEGVFGLWKGNLSALILYIVFGGIQFWCFHSLDGRLHSLNQPAFIKTIYSFFPSSSHTFLSGALAGSCATIVSYPFDLLRTRFAVQGNTKIYSSLLGALQGISRKEGVMGIYRGLAPSLLSILPQMGLIFESNRFFLVQYHRLMEGFQEGHLKTVVAKPMHLLCGGLAGIVTKTTFMPLDVIRKRLQVQGPIRQEILISNVPIYRGVFKAALQIIRDEGALALYKGLVPSLVKAASSSAITFFVVQEMRQFFSNVNE